MIFLICNKLSYIDIYLTRRKGKQMRRKKGGQKSDYFFIKDYESRLKIHINQDKAKKIYQSILSSRKKNYFLNKIRNITFFKGKMASYIWFDVIVIFFISIISFLLLYSEHIKRDYSIVMHKLKMNQQIMFFSHFM